MRVLVVEDEPVLRGEITELLECQGYVVDSAASGDDGLQYALDYPIDLAIVDLGLPGVSGLDIIRGARSGGCKYPILILTARSRWQEKVEGLEAGADDYVIKPFQEEELLARIRALSRRAGGWAQSSLRCDPIVLDPSSTQVTVNKRSVSLTAFEYKVLHLLMLRAGEVVTKTELIDRVYGDDVDRLSNVIEVFVRRLRQKLDPGDELKPIETVRGMGYRFNLPRTSGEPTPECDL